jgi:putative endonuclease
MLGRGGGRVHPKDALGRYGEQVAERHLLEAGFTVLDRNWRCAAGELDIVAREGTALVFCEVKTRSSIRFGLPVEAVTERKATKIRELALHWLREHPGARGDIRFDVLGVLRSSSGRAAVSHLRGAF